ncbi:MAG: hypothetical protein WCY93_10735 [Anaerolineaceae bacterium]
MIKKLKWETYVNDDLITSTPVGIFTIWKVGIERWTVTGPNIFLGPFDTCDEAKDAAYRALQEAVFRCLDEDFVNLLRFKQISFPSDF